MSQFLRGRIEYGVNYYQHNIDTQKKVMEIAGERFRGVNNRYELDPDYLPFAFNSRRPLGFVYREVDVIEAVTYLKDGRPKPAMAIADTIDYDGDILYVGGIHKKYYEYSQKVLGDFSVEIALTPSYEKGGEE